MSDPFNQHDDDCWECIAEQLEASRKPELAAELREAVSDPLRAVPGSPFDMITTMHHFSIEMATQACQISFRC